MHVTIVSSTPDNSNPQADVAHTTWRDEADCQRMAEQWAAMLGPALREQASVVIELHGTLGAGKTTFTRYLLRALGVQGRIKSPSYAVVEPHEVPGMAIWHFDFYRFNDPQEWEDAGFRDLFGSPGLKLVEWPEKAEGLLPPADLKLTLTPLDENQRHATVEASTPAGKQWLTDLKNTRGGIHD